MLKEHDQEPAEVLQCPSLQGGERGDAASGKVQALLVERVMTCCVRLLCQEPEVEMGGGAWGEWIDDRT